MNADEFRSVALGYMAASGDRSYPASAMEKIFNVSRREIVAEARRLDIPEPRSRIGVSSHNLDKRRAYHGRRQVEIIVKITDDQLFKLSKDQIKAVWALRFLESSLGRPVRIGDVAKLLNISRQLAQARLSAAQGPAEKSSSRRVMNVRAELIEELNREPTQTEVAKRLNITRQRVSQIYEDLALDGRSGQKAIAEPNRRMRAEHASKLSQQRLLKDREEAVILDIAESNPNMSQSEIGLLVGLSQSELSRILLSKGICRRYLYSPDEDELILDESRSPGEIGKLLNRSSGSIRNRRKLLKSGMGKSKWVPSMMEVDKILELYERFKTYAAVARELKLSAAQVRSVVVLNRINKFETVRCEDDE